MSSQLQTTVETATGALQQALVALADNGTLTVGSTTVTGVAVSTVNPARIVLTVSGGSYTVNAAELGFLVAKVTVPGIETPAPVAGFLGWTIAKAIAAGVTMASIIAARPAFG